MTAFARTERSAVVTPAVGLGRGRHIVVNLLVVVAAVLALVSILTLWADRQLLDNNAWKRASTQVIQDPEVRTALSTFLVNQLYQNVDVAQALENQLPPNVKHLAGPLASALRQPATATAAAILARPRVQQLWINTTTVAHEKLVNVLENKTGYGISTGKGVVTVDLHGLLTELGADLGVSASALEKIPPDAGAITVMRSDQLAAAQKGVRVVRVLSVWLTVAVVGLLTFAVFLARGGRRRTLRNVGWAFVVVGLVVLLVRRLAGNYAVDALASPGYRVTVRDVWLIGTQILGQLGGAAILYGLVVIAGTVLAGPMSWATSLRRLIAPTVNRRPGLAALGVGVLYLWIVESGPTHALRTWWGVLSFAVLIAIGLVALRRQMLAEFPLVERRVAADASTEAEPAEARGSVADELARLVALRDAGALSDDEFNRAKALALS